MNRLNKIFLRSLFSILILQLVIPINAEAVPHNKKKESKKAIIEKQIEKGERDQGEVEQCTICLDPLEKGEGPEQGSSPSSVIKLKCNHSFHGQCLKKNFDQAEATVAKKCPVCREEYKQEDINNISLVQVDESTSSSQLDGQAGPANPQAGGSASAENLIQGPPGANGIFSTQPGGLRRVGYWFDPICDPVRHNFNDSYSRALHTAFVAVGGTVLANDILTGSANFASAIIVPPIAALSVWIGNKTFYWAKNKAQRLIDLLDDAKQDTPDPDRPLKLLQEFSFLFNQNLIKRGQAPLPQEKIKTLVELAHRRGMLCHQRKLLTRTRGWRDKFYNLGQRQLIISGFEYRYLTFAELAEKMSDQYGSGTLSLAQSTDLPQDDQHMAFETFINQSGRQINQATPMDIDSENTDTEMNGSSSSI